MCQMHHFYLSALISSQLLLLLLKPGHLSLGKMAGIVLNPHTPAKMLDYLIDDVDPLELAFRGGDWGVDDRGVVAHGNCFSL